MASLKGAVVTLLPSMLIVASAALAQGTGNSRSTVEQISSPSVSVPQVGARPIGAERAQVRPSQATSRASGTGGPGQVGRADANTQVAAVPQEQVDLCTEAERTGTAPPEGVDCQSVLEALAAAAPRPSAEEALLGLFRPNGNTPAGTQQRAGSVIDADDVARRAAEGDVQNASDIEAVGAIRSRAIPVLPNNPN